MQVTTIGLDIAKNVFQVHGIDAAEKVVVRKQLRRRLFGADAQRHLTAACGETGRRSIKAAFGEAFLKMDTIGREKQHGFYAATACSLVQRNSVPLTQMRCMITANRRARATIAFFIPRRLAICTAQALSQDHLLVRVSMTWAAS